MNYTIRIPFHKGYNIFNMFEFLKKHGYKETEVGSWAEYYSEDRSDNVSIIGIEFKLNSNEDLTIFKLVCL